MTLTVAHMSKHAARGNARRRGSIYAVVLAMAILVSLIGLSAVAVGRINLRTAAGTGDSACAEILALSAVENAIAVVNSEAGWRNNSSYWSEKPAPEAALGTGVFSWYLRDELDGDVRLSAGGVQPVRVFGLGRVGEARRKYSVVLVPTGANLLTNPGMEAGVFPFEPESGNCVLETTSSSPHDGLRSLGVRSRVDRLAGPRQDVLGKVSSNKSYYVEAWIKMSSTPEIPRIALVVQGNGGLLGLGNWTEVYRAGPPQPVGLEWTRVGVALSTNWDGGTADKAYWRVETASTNQDFWVDDVRMIEATGPLVPMPMSPARETWLQEPND